jgi:linoleoyl-CoA desaturase
MAFFHRFPIMCFICGFTFNWAITTDFRQMKTYLKENYPTVKQRPKTLWTTLIITKVIYVSIWIVNSYWHYLVESANRFLYCIIAGLILSIVFQLAHVVEETENPTQTN